MQNNKTEYNVAASAADRGSATISLTNNPIVGLASAVIGPILRLLVGPITADNLGHSLLPEIEKALR